MRMLASQSLSCRILGTLDLWVKTSKIDFQNHAVILIVIVTFIQPVFGRTTDKATGGTGSPRTVPVFASGFEGKSAVALGDRYDSTHTLRPTQAQRLVERVETGNSATGVAGSKIEGKAILDGAVPITQDCGAFGLTGEAFIDVIQKILRHDSLQDIPFIESSLQVNFVAEFNQDANGRPDPRSLIYTANTALRSPIQVTLYVNFGHERQPSPHPFAFLRIQGQPWPSLYAEFLPTCLRISSAEFTGHFGTDFVHTLAPGSSGVVGASLDLGRTGQQGDQVSLRYSYNVDDELVRDVAIQQSP